MSKVFDDQGEMVKSEKHDIKFFEAAKDTARIFASAKTPCGLTAPVVYGAIALPSGDPVTLGWNDREIVDAHRQRACFFSLAGTTHEQMARPCHRPQCLQELAPVRRIADLTVQQRKIYGRSSIHSNQMKLGVPSAASLFDGSRSCYTNNYP